MTPTWDISIEYCNQAVYLSSQTLSKTALIILTLVLHIAALIFFFSIGFYAFNLGCAMIDKSALYVLYTRYIRLPHISQVMKLVLC